jgi:hypothetical protein
VRNEYAFGLDYARTLAEWRVAFEARWPEIQKLGFDETFRRLWRMYLCYCEAGFRPEASMSSSLNSRIVDLVAPGARQMAVASERRRALLLALAGLPFAAWGSSDPTAGLKRWGNGEFRRFGFLVYEATLWAGDDPQRPPLALRLDYKRNIEGKAIAEASVKEMRRFVADEALLKRWGEAMARLFPDVKPGDHILGVYRPEGAVFLFNGQALEIAEPAFARQFFAIWLDPRTSAPELREALLRRAG